MVSNIGDGYTKTFPDSWPNVWPVVSPPINPAPSSNPVIYQPGISQSDFDALRKEVEELKKLLTAAKKFDESTGQPHFEIDNKVELIKRIAKIVGVDPGDVFVPAKPKKTKTQRKP